MNAMNAMTKQKTETEKTKNRNRNRRGDAAHYYEELEELQLESVAAANYGGDAGAWNEKIYRGEVEDPGLQRQKESILWHLKEIDPNQTWGDHKYIRPHVGMGGKKNIPFEYRNHIPFNVWRSFPAYRRLLKEIYNTTREEGIF